MDWISSSQITSSILVFRQISLALQTPKAICIASADAVDSVNMNQTKLFTLFFQVIDDCRFSLKLFSGNTGVAISKLERAEFALGQEIEVYFQHEISTLEFDM